MFGNRNDFNFNFLFGNNNFMSPNQIICRSNMSDPKLKNTPSETDTDKISSEDNTNLTDNNEIGLSPNGSNNKNKTPGNTSSLNNDKTTIGKDARSNNQQNDSTINSFADGLNSLADTENSPIKTENNISNPSGISQRTKELVSLQSELAKKVIGSEVNGKKDESLLSLDGSKPMPVKPNIANSKNDYQGFYKQEESLISSNGGKPVPVNPNTATQRDGNERFYKQTESGEIKRLYSDTATPKGGGKMLSPENEGSGVSQPEAGKVELKYPDTATVKSGNQVVEGTEIAQTKTGNNGNKNKEPVVDATKIAQFGLPDENTIKKNNSDRIYEEFKKENSDLTTLAPDKIKNEITSALTTQQGYARIQLSTETIDTLKSGTPKIDNNALKNIRAEYEKKCSKEELCKNLKKLKFNDNQIKIICANREAIINNKNDITNIINQLKDNGTPPINDDMLKKIKNLSECYKKDELKSKLKALPLQDDQIKLIMKDVKLMYPITKDITTSDNFYQVPIKDVTPAKDEPSALIIDNHPEKLVGDGIGRVDKYKLQENKTYQLNSYHINKVDPIVDPQKDPDPSRQLVYNFIAGGEPTSLNLSNVIFNTGKTESKTGNVKEDNIRREDLKKYAYINGNKITDGQIEDIIKLKKEDIEKFHIKDLKGQFTKKNCRRS